MGLGLSLGVDLGFGLGCCCCWFWSCLGLGLSLGLPLASSSWSVVGVDVGLGLGLGLAGLFHAERTGQGQLVETSLFLNGIWTVSSAITGFVCIQWNMDRLALLLHLSLLFQLYPCLCFSHLRSQRSVVKAAGSSEAAEIQHTIHA